MKSSGGFAVVQCCLPLGFSLTLEIFIESHSQNQPNIDF